MGVGGRKTGSIVCPDFPSCFPRKSETMGKLGVEVKV